MQMTQLGSAFSDTHRKAILVWSSPMSIALLPINRKCIRAGPGHLSADTREWSSGGGSSSSGLLSAGSQSWQQQQQQKQ